MRKSKLLMCFISIHNMLFSPVRPISLNGGYPMPGK